MYSQFKMLLLRFRSATHKYPFLPSLVLFLLGLAVFGSSAYYNLVSRSKISSKINQIDFTESRVTEDMNEGEIAGVEIESTITNTPTPTTIRRNTTSTPTPTNKPAEIKEVHTKETIEEQTVVVVTATPQPTPSPTPLPSLTPTPFFDNDTFSAELTCTRNGETVTASLIANQLLKWCEIGVGGIAKNRFDPGGNTCSAEFGTSSNTCRASVSNYGDKVLSFEK